LPANLARGGPDPLTQIARLQFLSTEFEIQTNSSDLLEWIVWIKGKSQQELPVCNRYRINITWTGEEFRIADGMKDDFELSTVYTIENLYARMHRQALDNLPEHVGVRAVTGACGNHAFLIVGGKQSGKSTLAARMLLEGYDITGDELSLLRNGEAVPFPRRFQVPGDSAALIPHFEKVVTSFHTDNPSSLIAIDPTCLGRPWRIVPLKLSAIFFLEPNFGSQTTITSCGKLEMNRRMLPHTSVTNKGGNLVRELCLTVGAAQTFLISFGKLDSAISALHRLLPVHL
jgi:hypothetical protein